MSTDYPVIESNTPSYDCKWDILKNDTLKIKKLRIKKLMSNASKQLLRVRIDKVLSKIKTFLQDAYKINGL